MQENASVICYFIYVILKHFHTPHFQVIKHIITSDYHFHNLFDGQVILTFA